MTNQQYASDGEAPSNSKMLSFKKNLHNYFNICVRISAQPRELVYTLVNMESDAPLWKHHLKFLSQWDDKEPSNVLQFKLPWNPIVLRPVMIIPAVKVESICTNEIKPVLGVFSVVFSHVGPPRRLHRERNVQKA